MQTRPQCCGRVLFAQAQSARLHAPRSHVLIANRIVNQTGSLELMAVSVRHLRNGLQEVNVTSAADRNRAARSAAELMKMIFIKICAEFYLMHMVVAHGNHFIADRSKAVVMRITFSCNLRAAQDLVYVSLSLSLPLAFAGMLAAEIWI